MPDLSKTIEIIFEAVDRTGDGLRSAGAGINTFADGVGRVTGPLAGITDTIIKVDAGVAAMGAAFAAVAVNETVKFQDSLYLVEKQLGDSGVSMDKAREDIENLATTYGINANNVAESLAGFLAAGYDYETAAKLVETSTRFMIAGDLDAVKATDILNASLAGFRVSSVDAAGGAEKVGDILNKLADISSSRLLDPIADGFAMVSPIAKTAGLSMEETGAIVARLVDVFQSGEIAGTALSSGLNSLAAPSKEASEALDSIGVKTTDASGALRNSGDILKDLAGKWGTLTEAQQTEAAAIIFGKDQAAKFQVVLGDWAKIQDYLNQVIDKTSGAVGSMQREVEGKLELISTAVKIADESWRQFLEHVGAKIVDAGVSDFTKSVGLLGEAFKKVVDGGGLDPLFASLKNQFSALDAMLAKVAQNLPEAFKGVNWEGLIDAQNELGKAFGRLFDGLDLTTVDGLKKAIQAVIDTGESLVRISAGIVDGLKPFIAGLASVVSNINDSDDSTKQWAGEILGLAKGIDAILPSIGTLGEGIGALGTGLQALAGISIVKWLGGLSEGAGVASTALGKLGLAGAVLAAGVEAKNLWEILAQAPPVLFNLKQAAENNADSQEKLKDKFKEVSESTGLSITSMKELDDALKNGLVRYDEATGKWVRAADAIKDVTASTDLLTKEQIDASLAAVNFSTDIEKAAVSTEKASAATETLKTGTGLAVNVIRDAAGNVTGYAQAVGTLPEKLSDAAAKTDEATKKTESFMVKMEEIASNERIKNIEAKVKLDVAQLETDAQRVESVFDSIDNAVTSTGNLLGELFGALVDASTWSQKNLIEEQIKKESNRRDAVLELQKQMTEAEVARIEEQTRALARGDALIQVDGTGLAPQLEAFMWEVLKSIRVKANASFQDYLLGAAT